MSVLCMNKFFQDDSLFQNLFTRTTMRKFGFSICKLEDVLYAHQDGDALRLRLGTVALPFAWHFPRHHSRCSPLRLSIITVTLFCMHA